VYTRRNFGEDFLFVDRRVVLVTALQGDRGERYCETQTKEEVIYHDAESYIEISTRDEVLDATRILKL
jgi:hypothetical protein